MHYAFQDKENVYLIMDYLGGGDLRYHLIKYFKFNEEKTSNYFYYIINIINSVKKIK
jgi:serine/threonine protein kinase